MMKMTKTIPITMTIKTIITMKTLTIMSKVPTTINNYWMRLSMIS